MSVRQVEAPEVLEVPEAPAEAVPARPSSLSAGTAPALGQLLDHEALARRREAQRQAREFARRRETYGLD